MSNREVFKKFAQDKEGEGSTVRARKEGDTLVLYSYTTPIAFRDGEAGIFDARGYSVTTKKQRSQAMAQFPSNLARTMDHDAFRAHLRSAGISLAGAR